MIKGSHQSEEAKAKISAAMAGRCHSEEARAKMSAARVGKKMSTECCANISASKMGPNNPNYGKPHSAEHNSKIAMARLGKPHPCKKGAKRTLEQRRAQSERSRGRKNPHVGHPCKPETKAKLASYSGPKSPNWRGGISYEPYCPKFDDDLKTRIRTFFDNKCIICGKSNDDNGRELSCHHIEYDKMSCCNGKPVQFAALCVGCHSKTNYDRSRWESILHRTIEEIFSGRSYYTKEEWDALRRKN